MTKSIPISVYQRRYLTAWLNSPSETMYNISLVYYIRGKLDREKLKLACELALKRNEILYSKFTTNGRECFCEDYLISDFFKEVAFEVLSVTAETQLSEFLHNIHFDLTKKAFCAFLVSAGEDSYYFILLAHHAIADANFGLHISRQIEGGYNKNVNDSIIPVYPDDALEQAIKAEKDILTTEYTKAAKQFWLTFIGDFSLNVHFPHLSGGSVAKNELNEITGVGKSIFLTLGKEETRMLKSFVEKKSTTIFLVISAVFGLVISKYSKQNNFLINYPIDAREKGHKKAPGSFVNKLVLKFDFDQVKDRDELLKFLKEQRKETRKYEKYPYDNIMDDLKSEKELKLEKLFNIGISQTNLNTVSLKLNDLEVEPVNISWSNKIFNDIGLFFDAYSNDTIKFKFEYRKSLFEKEFLKKMVNTFGKILNEWISN